ncbi:UDP-glycosyltransferase 73E1-like [Miscanthus floridulus]|uniref:UDP-glycosyltransferase 73E1-like n=1 Tax=Miscanthus floridulus TaxID=154761 RepID=UPI0034587ED9
MAPTEESASAMPAPPPPSHFVIVPLVAQGHTIPMVDLARHLTERGARASLVTTPVNGVRLRGVAEQAVRTKLSLEIVELPLPTDTNDGLPPGIENVDQVTDNGHFIPLFNAVQKLAGPLEAYLRALALRPSCIISDWSNPWTAGVARRLGIPRLFFHGPSCFYSLCDLNAIDHGLREQTAATDDDQERFVVPGMPVHVEVTKATAPGFFNSPGWEALWTECVEAMRTADGAVVNTFADLEGQFVSCYEAALGKPVWTLGPLCLSNRDVEAMASRGDTSSDGVRLQSAVSAWLDTMNTDSVVFVSFGSLARKLPKQLFEVGHGLEDTGRPFLWVVKEAEVSAAVPEVQEWLGALEARTAGRGLVVRGWAPQLAILSHRAVGGFVTHCGWNSLLESVAHGVPVVTWPHFADQFLNERLVVDVLGVGVPVGVTAPVMVFDDENVAVARGDIVRAVSALMGEGEEADERRRKAKEYGEKAHVAMAKGGSSYENLTQLIESFRQCGGRKG